MIRLYELIIQLRLFFFFLFLEGIALWLISYSTHYQGAIFLNTANHYVGSYLEWKNGVEDYFILKDANRSLARENARLYEQVLKQPERKVYFPLQDSLLSDSAFLTRFTFKEGKVINNSVLRSNNYFTINVGTRDGIKPGMGVISPEGIAGRVKVCSGNFSVVYSLLHSGLMVSAKFQKNNELCTVRWDGELAEYSVLEYVPKHLIVKVGDTILTSPYSPIYPENIMVGTVSEVNLRGDQAFYDAKIKLSTVFRSLTYVYVIKNGLKHEQDSIELKVNEN